MLTNEQMELAASALRDQALAVIARHEQEDHGGAACMGNRASLIAYLAHCLGVRGPVWHYAERLRIEYDERCQSADCPHNPEAGDGR